jgi:hypothetical protein
MAWDNALVAITVYMVLFAIGHVIAQKTKGVIVEALFLSAVYLIAFITGLFPSDTLTNTGVVTVISSFGILLLVTNLGTMIELKQLLREWKTVVVCLGGMAVMAVFFLVIGLPLFGREYTLSALPPVAGGLVATGLVANAAEAAGKPDFGAFASLLCSLQTFFAVPLSSLLTRSYANSLVKSGEYLKDSDNGKKSRFPSFKVIKGFPQIMNDSSNIVARLLIVALIGYLVSAATGGTFPAAVSVLIFGIIFTELGFLEPQSLSKAGYMNFLLMGLVMTLPNSFRSLTLESFGNMLAPAIVFLLIGAASLTLGGAIVAKILKVDWRLGSAAALSAMFGYPLTEIISRDVVESFNLDEEKSEKLLNKIMPTLIVAGFTTVTIASVAIAGVIAPIIFQ